MTDLPDFVTPGQPVEALWGNEVVAALNAAVALLSGLLPVGAVAMYGGTTEPSGWLLCRGQYVSQATYTALYAVIGTRFNGSFAPPAGTFRVPNMQARYPVGTNVGGSDLGTLYWNGGVGERAGSYESQMPKHQHSVPDHLHSVNLWSDNESSQHVHWDTGHGPYVYESLTGPNPKAIHTNSGWGGEGNTSIFTFESTSGPPLTPHQHHLAGNTGSADRDLSTGMAGGSDQIPPGLAYNFIIRTGV